MARQKKTWVHDYSQLKAESPFDLKSGLFILPLAMKPFTSVEIKYFDKENSLAVKEWISEP